MTQLYNTLTNQKEKRFFGFDEEKKTFNEVNGNYMQIEMKIAGYTV